MKPSRSAGAATARVPAVDLLRGVAMIVMLLDHTRDYVHTYGFSGAPTDLAVTTPALFFTRWITHLCAPIFVFLAGTAAALQEARGKPRPALARYLVTRGLWLIVLELTVVRFGVFFDADPAMLGGLQVIWALGASMIVLAGLLFVPRGIVAAIGAAMILGHDLLDGLAPAAGTGPPTALQQLWSILHRQGPLFPFGAPGPTLFVLYPLIPWVGVMAVGYVLGGAIYRRPELQRRRTLLRCGAAMLVAFVVLRALNVYGDPVPWAPQRDAVYTAISFFNVSKYPPSLAYLLVTLGLALLALGLLEGRALIGRAAGVAMTFGRVPLFFYLLQWPLAHLIALGLNLVAGQPTAHLFANPMQAAFRARGPGFGLEVVYLSWIAGVALLYPLCRWFAALKRRRGDWWLSYL